MTLSSLFHLLGQAPAVVKCWVGLVAVIFAAGVYYVTTRAGRVLARVEEYARGRFARWREARRRSRFEARRARHFEQVHAAGSPYFDEKFAGIVRADRERAGSDLEEADRR